MEDADAGLYKRIAVRILPLLFLGYVVAFLDRVNVGFAKLQMAEWSASRKVVQYLS